MWRNGFLFNFRRPLEQHIHSSLVHWDDYARIRLFKKRRTILLHWYENREWKFCDLRKPRKNDKGIKIHGTYGLESRQDLVTNIKMLQRIISESNVALLRLIERWRLKFRSFEMLIVKKFQNLKNSCLNL